MVKITFPASSAAALASYRDLSDPPKTDEKKTIWKKRPSRRQQERRLQEAEITPGSLPGHLGDMRQVSPSIRVPGSPFRRRQSHGRASEHPGISKTLGFRPHLGRRWWKPGVRPKAFVEVNRNLPGLALSLHIWFQFSEFFGTLRCPDEIKSSECKPKAERAWENARKKRVWRG